MILLKPYFSNFVFKFLKLILLSTFAREDPSSTYITSAPCFKWNKKKVKRFIITRVDVFFICI